MKLIMQYSENVSKVVKYFDIPLLVPISTKYISVDAFDEICLWTGHQRPELDYFGKVWTGDIINHQVGKVDLEGLHWKETLKEV